MTTFAIFIVVMLFLAFFVFYPIAKYTEYYSVEGKEKIQYLFSLTPEELKKESIYDRFFVWYIRDSQNVSDTKKSKDE